MRSLNLLCAAAVMGLFALAAPLIARAVPIEVGAGGPDPFFVDPVYFIPPSAEVPNPTGLTGPGSGVDFQIPADAFAISACGVGQGCALSITTTLVTPVTQNPQNPAESLNPQTPQGTPTEGVPFVADSMWSVQNTSSVGLGETWLLFTSVDFTEGYPAVSVALDQFLYEVAALGEGDGASYFGSIALGPMGPGETKTLRVRYIVAGDLPDEGGSLVTPPLGVSGLVVPEPATLPLLALGLAALARLAERRRPCGD